MLYITGEQALNIPCNLETCGDWHTSALQWDRLNLKESTKSFFEDYGIEKDKIIPQHKKKYCVANHIRAILDLLEGGYYSVAQGMNKDFICNSKYDDEIFDKVYSMHQKDNWDEINKFMHKEYLMKWVNYVNERE